MKPRNFPEKKRQRQLGALRRLLERKARHETTYPKGHPHYYPFVGLFEIRILESRTDGGSRRDARSKKWRGA